MPEERNDGTYGYGNNLSFRVAQAEHTCRDHEKFIDDLRLARTEFGERIKTLEADRKRIDKEIEKINEEKEPMLRILNERMSRIDDKLTKGIETLAMKVDSNLETLTDKFNSFRLENKTGTIAILVSIIMTCIVVILSRLVTIPGAHV